MTEIADPMIRMRGVNKWFGRFHVLKDVDLTIGRGERIVVCGPSGLRQVDAHPLHQPAGGA